MIRREEIKRLAALARIKLSEGEVGALRRDIDAILSYVGEIQMVSPGSEGKGQGAPRNVLREDGDPHGGGVHTETLLAAAPNRKGNHIRVKKIL